MKKIFTLLFAVGTISIASAQSGRFGHDKQAGAYTQKDKQEEWQKFNRAHDYSVAAGGLHGHVNVWEQSKQNRFNENMRREELKHMAFRFEKHNGRYSDNKFAKNYTHRW